MIGEIIRGNISLAKISVLENPNNFAEMIKSLFFNNIISPRIILKRLIQPDKPRTKIITNIEFPNKAKIKIIRNRKGKAKNISEKRLKTESQNPPYIPAGIPNSIPKNNDTITEPRPIKNASRVP
ncbi:hypothetical protein BMS3Abin04_01691 [bacterium BMS3Abin04]|nr:hypothetical protein BMS3Abin04_01691 [bacterium BMS3Abin04]